MRDYRITKLTESIARQTGMDPKSASQLAKKIYETVDWNKKQSFHKIVEKYLAK